MFRLRRKQASDGDSATAVAAPPEEPTADFEGSTDELNAEIERLAGENRERPDRDSQRRLLRLRHVAGIRHLDAGGTPAGFPEPDFDRLPAGDGLPEIARDDVTPGLLRAGILTHGCLLVRGLVDPAAALTFADRIDRLFADHDAGGGELFEPFKPEARFEDVVARPWIRDGGGVLAADSPALSFEMLELFRSAQLSRLVDGYLGETAVISVHKTTLRKAAPSVPGAWHQDGSFMGDVRSLNLWLSLSRCGDVAPGLDLVPRRLEELVLTQTDEAVLPIQVSQQKAEQAAGDIEIVRPIFEPGDALFFDELFLHKTASDPAMPNPRYAIENWFFARSAFPADYAPVAVVSGAPDLDPYLHDPNRWGVSLAQSAELMLPCLDAIGARSVVEVGAFAGDLTRVLVHWARESGATVAAVDPSPQEGLVALDREHPSLELIRETSLEALPRIPLPDAIVIDGDHNYFTVGEELRLIAERSGEGPLPLLLFHDVCWPHARRDDYFAAEAIPADARHPIAGDRGGIVPGDPGVRRGGLPYRNSAAREGGERNGVLTAIEDFAASREGLRLAVVPVFFGFGVLWPLAAPWSDAVARIVDPFDRNPLLERLEANRVHHLAEAHARQVELWEAHGRRDRQEAVLRRLLESSAFGIAERLSNLRRRAGVASGVPAVGREDIRRVLD